MTMASRDLIRHILKEETEPTDKTSNGLNLAIKMLKKYYPYVKGWEYGDNVEDKYGIYINIICDIEKLKEFYNSDLKSYYYRHAFELENEKLPYAHSPLKINSIMDENEKFMDYKLLNKELNDIYEMMPDDLIKRDLFNDPKPIEIDKFMFK